MTINVYCSRLANFFRLTCWLATLIAIFYWIHVYYLNNDVCIIDYKKYYDTPSDEFPVLSICIKNSFSISKIQGKNPDFNESLYLQFLQGKYFSSSLIEIDYNDIRLNLSDYIKSYYFEWKNGSTSLHEYAREPMTTLTPSFAGFSTIPGAPTLYNCYAIRHPNAPIDSFYIQLQNSIFPASIRSRNFDLFTLLHYPNQLFMSYKTIKYTFPTKTTANSSYVVRFVVRGAEVLQRRNKETRPCNEDWKNYDTNVLQEHMENVGCRAPYVAKDSKKVPICSNKEQMARALLTFKNDDYGILPPCRSMEKISYTYTEQPLENSFSVPGTFWIMFAIFNPQFKEVSQIR